MRTLSENESTCDSRLVDLCLQGDRNAFEIIVARYQSIICAIAYSACGDIGRSEDLAQDTFIAAWRSLGGLKEPEKLKSWLCGIVRNLANHSRRRQRRTPTDAAEPVPPEIPALTATPSDQAISREEESLLWSALEGIPEIYREPMILFYRETQSTQAVAAALDLSEELVRKRLSRGREMLNERIAKRIEATLLKSSPGQSFTVGVLAALPAVTLSAKAAAVGATAAKGGATAKAAALTGLSSAILAPLLVVFGNYAGYRMGVDNASSDIERNHIKSFYRKLITIVLGFVAALGVLRIFGRQITRHHPRFFCVAIIAVAAVYGLGIIALSVWSLRRRRVILAGLQAEGTDKPVWEYCSRFRLFGLPLVRIQLGGCQREPVTAWIAAGGRAVGLLFAYGGLAIAPVSIGGLAIGLLPFGGFAVGVLGLGGFVAGVWSTGGMAAGWQAYGGCAFAWNAAMGGCAIARDFALGGFAQAAQANNAIATHFFLAHPFFRIAEIVLNNALWINLIWVVPMIAWWRQVKKKRTTLR